MVKAELTERKPLPKFTISLHATRFLFNDSA